MSAGRVKLDLKFWVLAVVGALSGTLTAANFVLVNDVRERQTQVSARQQYINESVQLARVNTQIIQALANMSAQTNDAALRDMLARHGVTFNVTVPAPGQPEPESAE